MARTALTPVEAADEGAVWALAAANVDGHMIDGDGDIVLFVLNGSGGSINVTVQTAATEDGLAVAEQIVAVAAGVQKVIGPFRPNTYNRASGDTDGGKVYIDFSAVATVTCKALKV